MHSSPYPPVAFAFSVYIAGDPLKSGGSFNEVSGLDAETDVLTVSEGGENQFSHKLPGRIKHSNLVLKRGVMKAQSPLMTWCQNILEGNLAQRIETKDIALCLLDETGNPTMTWALSHAYPVKWTVEHMAARDTEIAFETIEFAYQKIKRG